MPYSEKELDEIQYDPVRMKAYFWHVAMHAKRRARDGTHYLDKETEERFATSILENLDALVESCLLKR